MGRKWGYSSAGRAPALQAGGHRFEPDYLHHIKTDIENGSESLKQGLRFSDLVSKEAGRTLKTEQCDFKL